MDNRQQVLNNKKFVLDVFPEAKIVKHQRLGGRRRIFSIVPSKFLRKQRWWYSLGNGLTEEQAWNNELIEQN